MRAGSFKTEVPQDDSISDFKLSPTGTTAAEVRRPLYARILGAPIALAPEEFSFDESSRMDMFIVSNHAGLGTGGEAIGASCAP